NHKPLLARFGFLSLIQSTITNIRMIFKPFICLKRLLHSDELSKWGQKLSTCRMLKAIYERFAYMAFYFDLEIFMIHFLDLYKITATVYTYKLFIYIFY